MTQVDRVSQSITEQSEGIENQIDTDIRIISDTGSGESIYDGDSDILTLYVKNTGERELRPASNAVDVLVEGRFARPTNVNRVGGDDETIWPPGTVVEIVVEDVAIDGETRVAVRVKESEDTIRFRA